MAPTCRLNDLGNVALGFKSLQNEFFYLSTSTIASYHVEGRFLRPTYRLKDVDSKRYLQKRAASLRLFYCPLDERDLRGTGALRYIRAMGRRPATAKKQGGRPQTIQEALIAQGGSRWYAPKAQLRKAHIWLRKAIDSIF